MADKAAEYREKLIELAVEQDDDAMEAYLEGNEPDEETLKKLHPSRAPVSLKFVPVLNGTAFKNKGVQPLLDAVVDYPALAGRSAGRQGREAGLRRGRDAPLQRRCPGFRPWPSRS